ncbi:MAG: hypothetical protein R3337_06470 [Gammaproteobacteria bacterium]|nr:hypothetical protein [Gammaproteobacteria bacterium]
MKTCSRLLLATLLFVAGLPALSSADERIPANGDFTATVDFSTLSLSPVGDNCLLEVEGVIEFTGTLDGIAPARTRALVLASCDDVAVNPPGAFKDVFKSRLEFAGTVNGVAVIADMTYQGITRVGGDIDAVFTFSNGFKGVLRVDAIVAVGGSYRGFLKPSWTD